MLIKTLKMLPKKQTNIYPKSEENILAVIDFYFSDVFINRDNSLEMLKESPLSLNQIEFMLRKLSEAYGVVFQKYLYNIKLDNLITYAIDALLIGECKSGSQSRKKITLEFQQFVINSESI